MKQQILAIAVTLSLLLPPAAAEADCFFVGLREVQIAKGSDVFGVGDMSPLIALEPGRFYPLAPRQMEQAPHGEVFPGQLYYIPRDLVDANQRFSLRLMLIDRDQDTPDDLVLPLTQRWISLAPEHFANGARPVTLNFTAFLDAPKPQSNSMQFEFTLRKRSGPCNENTLEGRIADQHYRRENEIKRLLTRVMLYEQPHLVGGQEYLPYRIARFEERRQSTAVARAFDVAKVNASELIALGEEIRLLKDSTDFEELWVEYVLLVQRLAKQRMTLQYKDEEGVAQTAAVPSLASHSGWKKHRINDALPVLPEEWGISLSDL